MDEKFSKPKGFGEILDHTFQLTKNSFKDLFMILIIFMGPVYLVQAVLSMFAGTHFFRNTGTGNVWYEQMASRLAGVEESNTLDTTNLSAAIGIIVVGLISAILFPVAEAAVLLLINSVRKNEDYTVGGLIKQAFSRFWPILGSTILFGLIVFALFLIPILIIGFGTAAVASNNTILAILMGVVLFLGFAVGIGLLITRWSFYFAAVVLDKDAPGLSRSWRLSKKQTWKLVGLYIVFYLIISTISFAIQSAFAVVLGNSVLLQLIVNIATLFTTMIFAVGYAVMYLDLKTRHDADDLKELIEDYKMMD